MITGEYSVSVDTSDAHRRTHLQKESGLADLAFTMQFETDADDGEHRCINSDVLCPTASMYLQSRMLTASVLDDAEIEDFCPFRADDVDVESEEEESSDCYDSRLGRYLNAASLDTTFPRSTCMKTKGGSRHVDFDLECGWSDLKKGQDRQARIAGFYHESVLQNLTQDPFRRDCSEWEGVYDPLTASTATPPSEPEGAESSACVCFVA